MRPVDVAELARELHQGSPPAEIWQEPFDFDPAHYERLCDPRRRPSNIDLCSYADDYRYQESIQPDLLKFLLPRLLQAWAEDLLDLAGDYGGFAEQCLAALAAKPLYPAYLDQRQFKAVADYVGTQILARMSQEKHLLHRGSRATPYKWVHALGSYMVVFPYLQDLWEEWWAMRSEPYALCAAQYLSCLLYEDEANPIFELWTPTEGGGAPSLFETDGHIYEQSTHPANVQFLETILTPEYVREKLVQARQAVTQPDHQCMLDLMLEGFDRQLPLLRKRLAALPLLLAQPKQVVSGWDDVI